MVQQFSDTCDSAKTTQRLGWSEQNRQEFLPVVTLCSETFIPEKQLEKASSKKANQAIGSLTACYLLFLTIIFMNLNVKI